MVTFASRRATANDPDVQFGAVEKALPALDIVLYRAEVLRRLGDLVAPTAAAEHRFVKFSYERLIDASALEQATRAFEWMLCELRCAAATEAAAAPAT